MCNSAHYTLEAGIGERAPSPACLIRFHGQLSEIVYDMILERVEDAMVQRTEDRRPFRAFVEALQNVYKHGDMREPVTIWVGGHMLQTTPVFRIVTENVVVHDRIEELQTRLENLGNFDTMATRAALRIQLVSGTYNDRSGAGLGLLTLQSFAEDDLEATLLDTPRGKVLRLEVDVASQG
jgi:hypothetical protein